MNNRVKILIFVFAFIAIVFGADRLLKLYSNREVADESEIVDNRVISGEIIEEQRKIKEVTLENFNEEVLESDKPVLIDFYATWCEPCKMLSPTIEEIANEREDVKVVKVDVDNEVELAMQYKAYSIPTLVVISSGEEVDRRVGLVPKAQIENML